MKMKNRDWSDVTDKEVEAFSAAVEELRAKMLPTDSDDSYPVDIILIDRRKHEPMHWFPVPYRHKSGIEETEDAALTNLSIALDRVRTLQRIKEHAKFEAQNRAEKFS